MAHPTSFNEDSPYSLVGYSMAATLTLDSAAVSLRRSCTPLPVRRGDRFKPSQIPSDVETTRERGNEVPNFVRWTRGRFQ